MDEMEKNKVDHIEKNKETDQNSETIENVANQFKRQQQKIYKFDDEGYYTGSFFIYVDELEHYENFTVTEPNEQLQRPKWDGTEWVEDYDPLKSFDLDPLAGFESYEAPLLVLRIYEDLKKGGVDVNSDWFFQFAMYQYVNGYVGDEYLALAKKIGLLDDDQISLIKMSKMMKKGE